MASSNTRDKINAQTPMRCPVCDSAFDKVMIRDLGGLTADLIWQLHAGHCADHGWFQAEVISRPPREIFAVDRPFGIARRIVIDGREQFSFPTVWNFQSAKGALRRVDPFDPEYWRPQRQLRR